MSNANQTLMHKISFEEIVLNVRFRWENDRPY